MKDFSEHMHVYAICAIAMIVLNVAALLIPAKSIESVPMVDETITHHHIDDIPVLESDGL